MSVSAPSSPLPFTPPQVCPTLYEPTELATYADDAIYLLGGQFAILCQFAHPSLAAGTYHHSNFASRLLDRLKTTSRFLNVAVLGSPEEKAAIFSVIHQKHSVVRGEGYTADDPELHKWTAATLFMAFVVVHEALFGKISTAKLDTMYKEAAVYGTSLRMPGDMWPKTLDEFMVYWNTQIETLKITDHARSLCKDLMWPKKIPLIFKPIIPFARLLTIYWLPERLTREYGFKTSSTRLAMYHFTAGYLALVYPMVPKRIKSYPSRYYRKDLKKAVKQIQEKGTWVDGFKA